MTVKHPNLNILQPNIHTENCSYFMFNKHFNKADYVVIKPKKLFKYYIRQKTVIVSSFLFGNIASSLLLYLTTI